MEIEVIDEVEFDGNFGVYIDCREALLKESPKGIMFGVHRGISALPDMAKPCAAGVVSKPAERIIKQVLSASSIFIQNFNVCYVSFSTTTSIWTRANVLFSLV